MARRIWQALNRVRRLLRWPRRHAIVPEVAAALRGQKPCQHCGGYHLRPEPSCYRIRRIVFNDAGNLHEIEYWPHGAWPTDHIVFPEDLPPEEGE